MKKLQLTKFIASTLILFSTFILNPVSASAEWRQDSTGWWYADGNSWAVGWKEINGKWYYFDDNGYMEHDKLVEGFYLNSDGAWMENTDKVENKDYENHEEIQAYENLLCNPKLLKEKYNFYVSSYLTTSNYEYNAKIENEDGINKIKIYRNNVSGLPALIYKADIVDIDGDGTYEVVVDNEINHVAAKTSILTYKNGEVQLVNDNYLGVFCSEKEKVILASDQYNGTGNGGIYKLENGKLNEIHSYNITLTPNETSITIDGQSVNQKEANNFFKQYIDTNTTHRNQLPIVFINPKDN